MKQSCFILLTFTLALTACGGSLTEPYWPFTLPEAPAAWDLIPADLRRRLCWRIEYAAADGQWRRAEPGSSLELPQGWPSPVLAWPYIPGTALQPGTLKPAGAVFPFDAAGGELRLSWRGGVDAYFYRELAAAWTEAENARQRGGTALPAVRKPQFFDWPRFRCEGLPDAVAADPWTADWETAAAGTIRSGFDRRRIKVRKPSAVLTPGGGIPEGVYGAASPFAAVIDAAADRDAFPVTENPSVWFSAQGVLKANGSAGDAGTANRMFLLWNEM